MVGAVRRLTLEHDLRPRADPRRAVGERVVGDVQVVVEILAAVAPLKLVKSAVAGDVVAVARRGVATEVAQVALLAHEGARIDRIIRGREQAQLAEVELLLERLGDIAVEGGRDRSRNLVGINVHGG